MSNLLNHSVHEFALLPSDDSRKVFQEELIALVSCFADQGHSGGSAPFGVAEIVSTIERLLSFQPLSPLLGTDEEWVDVSDYGFHSPLFQNCRHTSVFRGSNGSACYLDAILWFGVDTGSTFTGNVEGISSSLEISFPFTPKTFSVDVSRLNSGEDAEYSILYPRQLENIRKYYPCPANWPEL
jgi:hypothetical protein